MIPARPFLMIRHGETVMNAQRLNCGGGVDTVLNDEGRRQAFEAATVLAAIPQDLRPTLIIHSNMKRTIETTDILNAELKLPVLSDHDLREHMLGEWEGKRWDDCLPLMRANVKPVGGESRAEFAARIRETFIRNLNAHPSERVMFVAHGGVFHSFQYMHGQSKDVFIHNARLHRFEPEPAHNPMPWRITMYEWKERLHESPAPLCPSQPEAN